MNFKSVVYFSHQMIWEEALSSTIVLWYLRDIRSFKSLEEMVVRNWTLALYTDFKKPQAHKDNKKCI